MFQRRKPTLVHGEEAMMVIVMSASGNTVTLLVYVVISILTVQYVVVSILTVQYLKQSGIYCFVLCIW